MMSAAFLVTTLKYLVLSGCAGAWAYAAYHGSRFESRLTAHDPFAIEALNHPMSMFRNDLPKRARESRRKVYRALTLFAVLGVVLLVILCFDTAGPAKSTFVFH